MTVESMNWSLKLFVLLVFVHVCLSTKLQRLFETELKLNALKNIPIVDPPERVAGYFKLNRTHDARMFYFFFEARTESSTAPLVMWLQGGPGCSSEFALFYENGPYSINDDLSLNETPYGWDINHNMLFIDQPIGTGFSYSTDERDLVHDEETVANDLLDFLLEFYELRPHLRDLPLYLSGESYAGHYIPATAYAIWRASYLRLENPINLAGLAMGNPLTNPKIQFGSYGDFAFENKIISKQLRDSINWWYPLCSTSLDWCTSTGYSVLCQLANFVCQFVAFGRVLDANPGINVYDITKNCNNSDCYDTSLAEKLLNSPEVRAQLGVGDLEWEGCSATPYNNLAADLGKPYHTQLVPLLEDGIRVLVYAGERDLICNWMGNQRWLDALAWEGSDGWAKATEKEWFTNEKDSAAAGTIRSYDTLSFVRVKQAGHMSPLDQPASVFHLITAFTREDDLAKSARSSSSSSSQVGKTTKKGKESHLLPGATWKIKKEVTAEVKKSRRALYEAA